MASTYAPPLHSQLGGFSRHTWYYLFPPKYPTPHRPQSRQTRHILNMCQESKNLKYQISHPPIPPQYVRAPPPTYPTNPTSSVPWGFAQFAVRVAFAVQVVGRGERLRWGIGLLGLLGPVRVAVGGARWVARCRWTWWTWWRTGRWQDRRLFWDVFGSVGDGGGIWVWVDLVWMSVMFYVCWIWDRRKVVGWPAATQVRFGWEVQVLFEFSTRRKWPKVSSVQGCLPCTQGSKEGTCFTCISWELVEDSRDSRDQKQPSMC